MVYKKILNQVPADYYDKGVKSNLFQWLWHSWKWKSLKIFLEGLDGEILDIGCADGSLTAKVNSFLPHAKLTGVDLYEKAIRYAKKKNPQINFIKADGRKLPFRKNFFSGIICVETLEHIPSNPQVLKEMHRVLKNNGYLIIAQDTDSFIFRTIWFFWTKWKGKVWDGSHVSCLKPMQIASGLEKNGFKIIKKNYSHLGLEVIFKARKKLNKSRIRKS